MLAPPASIDAPFITGTAQQGHVLSAHAGSWSPSPSARALQWLRCEEGSCEAIEGAEQATYMLAAEDVGHTIALRETARDEGGWGAAVSEPAAVGAPPKPRVIALEPDAAGVEGGAAVIITGEGLGEAQDVSFGFAAASSFEILSPSRIRAIAPAASAGSVYVTVTTPAGTSAVEAPARFTFGAVPVATGLSVSSGPEAGATVVTISGANLAEASAVRFGTRHARSFGAVSAGAITAVAPPGTGTVGVTVTTPFGTTTAGTAEQYTYLSSGPLPEITKLSEDKGPAAGATALTISGRNLAEVSAVQFGSTPAASFTVLSSSAISVVSPPGTAGVVNVTVSTPYNSSAITVRDRFKYSNPTITGVSPASGPQGGGTVVTVTGSGFATGEAATVISFGKDPGRSVECASSSECTVLSPPASTGSTVDLRAQVSGKLSKRAPGDQFSYE